MPLHIGIKIFVSHSCSCCKLLHQVYIRATVTNTNTTPAIHAAETATQYGDTDSVHSNEGGTANNNHSNKRGQRALALSSDWGKSEAKSTLIERNLNDIFMSTSVDRKQLLQLF